MRYSDNTCYGYTAWKYNTGTVIAQDSYFLVRYTGGDKNVKYYSWGNPSVWRTALGKYQVYTTAKTPAFTTNEIYGS